MNSSVFTTLKKKGDFFFFLHKMWNVGMILWLQKAISDTTSSFNGTALLADAPFHHIHNMDVPLPGRMMSICESKEKKRGEGGR